MLLIAKNGILNLSLDKDIEKHLKEKGLSDADVCEIMEEMNG